MKVLITGGHGYIGGRLGQALSARPAYAVTLGSRRPADPPSWLQSVRAAQMDWTSKATLERACAGNDAVVHLAGMNAADCAADPARAFEVNATGTANLVAAAAAAGVTRFVYVSTAHVYGVMRGEITEQTCAAGRHPYAVTHRAAEDAVRMAHDAGRLECAVVRLSNAYGAPAHEAADCWTLLVNDLCRQAVASGHMVLRSPGTQQRDFITMSDACDALAHLLDIAPGTLGDGVFNVGGNWSLSVLEMAELLAGRFEAIAGTRPLISREEGGVAGDAAPLRFATAKLSASGFDASGDERRIEELDGLVRFCVGSGARP
jgi:UDP-glucose 4-epimerase